MPIDRKGNAKRDFSCSEHDRWKLGREQRSASRRSQWYSIPILCLRLVPNALHFIDKYNQVPRILNPMVLAIDGIDTIAKNPFIFRYIEEAFGGVDTLKKSNPFLI
jgi:Protein of unknown function (DUF2009)